MKFRSRTKIAHRFDSLNIAPLIDVIFQLLIFFMLTSSFAFPSGIDVKLPKALTSDLLAEENLVITITSENIIYWDNTVVTLKELRGILDKPSYTGRPLLIKSDRRASVGRIVEIWDLCRSLNIQKINIATNQPQ